MLQVLQFFAVLIGNELRNLSRKAWVVGVACEVAAAEVPGNAPLAPKINCDEEKVQASEGSNARFSFNACVAFFMS